jgi:hypothetical protein
VILRVLAAAVLITLLGSYSLATGPINLEFVAALSLLFTLSLIGCVLSWLVWRISARFEPDSARYGARAVAIVGLGATWATGFIFYAFLPLLALPAMLCAALLTISPAMLLGWLAGRTVHGTPGSAQR